MDYHNVDQDKPKKEAIEEVMAARIPPQEVLDVPQNKKDKQ